jgi:transposase
MPSVEELATLPRAVLAERLAEAYQLIGELSRRVERLERRAGTDSSNSSRPPSSDSPYAKKPRARSLRERTGRRPGKQPGDPGTTMRLTDHPDRRVECPPARCAGCGTDLADVPVLAARRHQVTEPAPVPPPVVTEYVAQAKTCPGCGVISEGGLPAHVRARASYGPEAHARAAYLTCAQFLPVSRAARALAQLGGVPASAGWLAGVRGKTAALIEASAFGDTVRALLRASPAIHADETPARAAGGLRYVHVACTPGLTWMHTGDRSAAAIDAGGVLPGYDGILVRDGYHGYGHLTQAAHAWCGAHLLRDLKAVHDTGPGRQEWAAKMGCLLLWAAGAAADARRDGQTALHPATYGYLVTSYQAIARHGELANIGPGSDAAARALARRLQRSQHMILRFAAHPALDIFTNNEAERTIRCVKVQQRTSGGCWRTLQGLADFAIVQSYLSTAAKWHIPALDALRDLFQGRPWTPPALETPS